jgi:acyl carrier protein
MGLDGVELVMNFEEAFGIELKDEEVTKTVTPRMVVDLIFSKLRTADERICQSQRAFYLLRRAFLPMFNLERRSITPEMRFRALIPKSREKERWEQIKVAVAARSWPRLTLPFGMSWCLTAIGFAVFGGTVFIAIRLFLDAGLGIIDWVYLGVLLGIGGIFIAGLFRIAANRLTRRFGVRIPYRFKSMRDLVPYAITSDHIQWTREQVSAVVKRLVMEQLGLDESQYTEDSRFVEDFRMDS